MHIGGATTIDDHYHRNAVEVSDFYLEVGCPAIDAPSIVEGNFAVFEHELQ